MLLIYILIFSSNIEIEHAPFDINPCQSSISPGQTQLVNVTFSPGNLFILYECIFNTNVVD